MLVLLQSSNNSHFSLVEETLQHQKQARDITKVVDEHFELIIICYCSRFCTDWTRWKCFQNADRLQNLHCWKQLRKQFKTCGHLRLRMLGRKLMISWLWLCKKGDLQRRSNKKNDGSSKLAKELAMERLDTVGHHLYMSLNYCFKSVICSSVSWSVLVVTDSDSFLIVVVLCLVWTEK